MEQYRDLSLSELKRIRDEKTDQRRAIRDEDLNSPNKRRLSEELDRLEGFNEDTIQELDEWSRSYGNFLLDKNGVISVAEQNRWNKEIMRLQKNDRERDQRMSDIRDLLDQQPERYDELKREIDEIAVVIEMKQREEDITRSMQETRIS